MFKVRGYTSVAAAQDTVAGAISSGETPAKLKRNFTLTPVEALANLIRTQFSIDPDEVQIWILVLVMRRKYSVRRLPNF